MIDLPRLCDYVEIIPPLPTAKVGKIIATFGSRCPGMYPDDVQTGDKTALVPTAASPVATLFGLDDDVDGGEMKPGPLRALTGLLNTPRLLKMALRQMKFVWGQLHGEISFDDALLTCALRVGAPQAYSLLISKADSVRKRTPAAAIGHVRTFAIAQCRFAIDAEARLLLN